MKATRFFTYSFILFAIAYLTSCTTSKKTSSSSENSSSSSIQDGSSFENAIVIDAKSEGPGVDMEYEWLREHYPGYKLKMQKLVENNGKPYDKMYIVTRDGKEKTIFFDISKFFGKF